MPSGIDVQSLLCEYDVAGMRRDLLQWWSMGRRQFPWRETCDPYKLIIAEVMLHRTRAEQVVPLYQMFLGRFPDIFALSKSTPDELAQLLRSGGLQWRWKLLHTMAEEIVAKFGGEIPGNFNDLSSLPGISSYIASAVRCFAFGYPDVLLDTNTVRVAGRVFDLQVTDSSRRSHVFRSLLQGCLDVQHPREFNFGLIDLAAKICTVRTPQHEECCLKGYCSSYNAE